VQTRRTKTNYCPPRWNRSSEGETRTLSCLLHPPLLDEVGFASAARWYTDEFAKRSGIEVKLDLPDGIDRLPELTEIALFRILQESLTNVHRHSGSSSVEIGLTVTDNRALLSVQDFERVTDLGGSFDIESDSHGTAIIVAFALAAQPSGESRASQENLGKKFAA
jgi:signal transduction histidine kinase